MSLSSRQHQQLFQKFHAPGQNGLVIKGEVRGVKLGGIPGAQEEEQPRHILLVEGEVLRRQHRLFHEGRRVIAQLGDNAPTLMEKPVLAAEDFSFYQQYVPGLFFFLGTGDTPQLHAPDFTFDDEAVLPRGVEFLKKLLMLP